MGNWIRIVRSVIIHDNVGSGQGAKRKGLNELAGAFGHRYSHRTPGSLQSAQDFRSLVRSNAAGYSQRYLLTGKVLEGSLIRHDLQVRCLTRLADQCNIGDTAAQ